jgi:hypothetical protein
MQGGQNQQVSNLNAPEVNHLLRCRQQQQITTDNYGRGVFFYKDVCINYFASLSGGSPGAGKYEKTMHASSVVVAYRTLCFGSTPP